MEHVEIDGDGEVRTPLARLMAFLTGGGRSMRRTRDFYLRVLGGVFFCAFASWYWQQPGLIGSEGILPASDYLSRAREALGGRSFTDIPTVLWFGSSDAALSAVALCGLLCSALLLIGYLPLFALFGCWLFYLSLSVVGGVFMHFQWDALLLEAAVMSLPVCPLALRLSAECAEPHPIAIFLPRWLLFRLMFLSGWVKLASHDATWRGLTALMYHYWTQPLPTWTAWIADGAPRFVHQLSAAVMFLVELGAPFFLFAPRRLRLYLGVIPLVALQLLILATGNYGFFNLLTLALCIPALDDAALGELAARLLRRPATVPTPGRRAMGSLGALRSLAAAAAFAVVMMVTIGQLSRSLIGAEPPGWQQELLDAVHPFRSISTYGLFASMTTDRLDIAIEGSNDGKAWRPYRFKWKPGPVDERPRFTTPHMPRLDWQMWFAALGDCRGNGWLVLFQKRLLEGSKPALALLANDPFPDHPPRYLRTPLYRYRFSDFARWRKDGAWWTRAQIGEFCPPLKLEGGQIRRMDQTAQ